MADIRAKEEPLCTSMVVLQDPKGGGPSVLRTYDTHGKFPVRNWDLNFISESNGREQK